MHGRSDVASQLNINKNQTGFQLIQAEFEDSDTIYTLHILLPYPPYRDS